MESIMKRLLPLIAVAALSLAVAATAQPQTRSLQGGDAEQQFMNDPNLHAFYDLSRAQLGKGAGPLDFNDYQAKSFVLFRAMGAHMGMTPDQMQDHLKLIPGQMVQIVKDDPKVLDSYANFVAALVGPR
jgi:hypothetical protein